MKKRWLFGMMVVFGLFLAACNEESEPEEEIDRVVAVETAEVEQGDFIIERSIFGRAMPVSMNPVMLPAPGEITELNVRNGDMVEEGERLAVVETAQGNRNIDAPQDGQIASLQAKENSFVSNEDVFAMINNTEEMIVEFSITAQELERFTIDETYALRMDQTEWKSTLTMLDAMPGENGLYAAEATVENPDGDILTGNVLELIVEDIVEEETLLVPTEAVITENNEEFVYVVENNQAELRSVTVLQKGSHQTAIEGDVTAGDSVVTVGQLTLADGETVTVETEEGE